MVLEREVNTVYICELCGRMWTQKHLAEYCEELCEAGLPIKISKKELKARREAKNVSSKNKL